MSSTAQSPQTASGQAPASTGPARSSAAPVPAWQLRTSSWDASRLEEPEQWFVVRGHRVWSDTTRWVATRIPPDGFTQANDKCLQRHKQGSLCVRPRSPTATFLWFSRTPSVRWAMDWVRLEAGTFHVLQDDDPDKTDDPSKKSNPRLPVDTADLTECQRVSGSKWDDWRLAVELQHATRPRRRITWKPIQSFLETPVPPPSASNEEIDDFLRPRMEQLRMAGWFKDGLHEDQQHFCQTMALPSKGTLAGFYRHWAYNSQIPPGSLRPSARPYGAPSFGTDPGGFEQSMMARREALAPDSDTMFLPSTVPSYDPLGFIPRRPGPDLTVPRRSQTLPTSLPYGNRPFPSFPSTHMPSPPRTDPNRATASSTRHQADLMTTGQAMNAYRRGAMPDAHLLGPTEQNMTYVSGQNTDSGEGPSWRRPSPFSFATNLTQEDFGHSGGGNTAERAGDASTNTPQDPRQGSRPFAPTSTPDPRTNPTHATPVPRLDRSAIRHNAAQAHAAWVAARPTPSGPSGPPGPGPGSREMPLEIVEDPPRNDISPASTSASTSGRGGGSLLRYVSGSTHTPVADDPDPDPDPEEPSLFAPPPRSLTWPTRAPDTPSQRELMPPPPRPQAPLHQAPGSRSGSGSGSGSTSPSRPPRTRLPNSRSGTLAFPSALGTLAVPFMIEDEAETRGSAASPAGAVIGSSHPASPLRMPAIGEIQPEMGLVSPSEGPSTRLDAPGQTRRRYTRLGPLARPRVDNTRDPQEESSASAGGLREHEDRAASSRVGGTPHPREGSSNAASGRRGEDDVEADSGAPY